MPGNTCLKQSRQIFVRTIVLLVLLFLYNFSYCLRTVGVGEADKVDA